MRWGGVGVAVFVDEYIVEFLAGVVLCVSVVVGDRIPVLVVLVGDAAFECSVFSEGFSDASADKWVWWGGGFGGLDLWEGFVGVFCEGFACFVDGGGHVEDGVAEGAMWDRCFVGMHEDFNWWGLELYGVIFFFKGGGVFCCVAW